MTAEREIARSDAEVRQAAARLVRVSGIAAGIAASGSR
jgi:hypothetical protein